MDSLTRKPSRKRLSELLVEAGIVKPEELPKGLEYAQRATEADVEAINQVKGLIKEQGLSVPTALRALTLAKQRHCEILQALAELGWRPRKPDGFNETEPLSRQIKSAIKSEELDSIGTAVAGKPGPVYETDLQRNTWSGLKAKATNEHELASKFLKGEMIDPIALAPSPVSGPAGFEMEPAVPADKQDWSMRESKLPPLAPPVVETTFAPDGESGAFSGTSEMEAFKPGFVDAMRAGDAAFAEHNFEDALKQYSDALSSMENNELSSPMEIASVLVKLGRSAYQLSDFARCEDAFCRALKIRESELGGNDIGVAECLDYLAEMYDVQSQFLQAEQYYLGALGIKERAPNPDKAEIVRSLKKLVAVSKRRGPGAVEDKKSGELLTEAGLVDPARIQEGLAVAAEKSLPIGRALISLHYLTDQDLEAVLQAQLLLREGVIPAYLAVRALRLASEQHISFEKALREIGLEPGDATAEPVFSLLRAANELLQAERQLGVDDPGVATLCMKVGDVYMDNQKYPQAEQLYRRALAIREKDEEGEAKDEADVLSRIADLLFRQQRYDEAQDMYVRLLDLWEVETGPDDINFITTLESLAAVHYVKSDFREAGRLYQLAIGGKEKLLGEEHPSVASALQGRANCFYAVQRYPEAEQLYRRAVAIYEKIYGANNDQVGILQNVLGDLFYTQGAFDKAQEEYARGLNALSNCSNPDVWTFTSMLEKSAHCFAQLGDQERADAYYQHLARTRQSLGMA